MYSLFGGRQNIFLTIFSTKFVVKCAAFIIKGQKQHIKTVTRANYLEQCMQTNYQCPAHSNFYPQSYPIVLQVCVLEGVGAVTD